MKAKIDITEMESEANRLVVHLSKEQEVERELLKLNVAGRKWNKEHKYWTVPYTQDTVERLAALFPKQYQLTFTIKKDIPLTYEGTFYPYANPSFSRKKIKFYLN